MSTAALPCIACDRPMTRVMDDGYPWQPDDGLMCSTSGNYGSTVFDPITGCVRLYFVLCDDCAKAKAQTHIMVNTVARNVTAVVPGSDFTRPSVVGIERLQREAVEWDPEVDYEEPPIEVEWEEVGTKMGAIEWGPGVGV